MQEPVAGVSYESDGFEEGSLRQGIGQAVETFPATSQELEDISARSQSELELAHLTCFC